MMGVVCSVVAAAVGFSPSGNFESEQGGLGLAWSMEDDAVTFTLQANASSYVAIGFGTGMTNLDVVLCWIDNGDVHAVDSWSVGHSLPMPDESFGGNIAYHMKQHGHWQLDLSKSDGVPE